MRQYFVDFIKDHESAQSQRGQIIDAFETGELLAVSGQKETVPVTFDLEVYSLTMRRIGAAKVLHFAGIAQPDNLPYTATYDETLPSSKIELRINPELT